MPESPAGSAAFLSGEEIVNDARTLAYLDAGYGHPSLRVSGCSCPRIRELIECGSDPYVSPAADPAPWYDSSVPESADFAGFLMTEFEGLGSTFTRVNVDKITGGAVLGRLRPQPRTLTWRGYLFGRSDCAVQFGLKWLTSNLRGSSCFCGGEDLDLLVCCPDLIDAPPVMGCVTSEVSPWVFCPGVLGEGAGAWIANAGPVPLGYTYPEVGHNPNLDPLMAALDGTFGEGWGGISLFSAAADFSPCDLNSEILRINYTTPDGWGVSALNGDVPTGPNLFVIAAGPNFNNTDPHPTWAPSSAITGDIVQLATGQPIAKPEPCPPFTQPDAFRTLKNVGLIDGPKILDQRRIGCSSGCGNISCDGDTLIMHVEFSLLAGNPYLFSCPVCLCAESPFPTAGLPECNWVKVADSNNPGINCTEEDVCPPTADCSVDSTDACPKLNLPVLPPFVDACFCRALAPVQFCCSVPADSFGQFFEGAPVIEIYSGSSALRSTTIRFFENLIGQECCDVATNPCVNCDELLIRFIPANSTMTIDGTTRSITLLCPGMTTPIQAEHLTVTPFSWPMLQCIDFCICTETDGGVAASDATVTVSIVPREM